MQLVQPLSNRALVRVAEMFWPYVKTGVDGEFAMQLPSMKLRFKFIARYFMKNRARSYTTRVPVTVVREGDRLLPIELSLHGLKNSKK